MNGVIKLRNPIDVNGKKVKELRYDTDAITSQHFAEADACKMKASGAKSGNLAGAVELDYSFHLYLGFAAIVAVNQEIDFNDLERMQGGDLMQVMKVGRNFTLKSDEESPDDGSSEPSETSPDATTPQSPTSSEDL